MLALAAALAVAVDSRRGPLGPPDGFALEVTNFGGHPRPCSGWLRRHATLGAGLRASWAPFGIQTSRGFAHDLQVGLHATPSQC